LSSIAFALSGRPFGFDCHSSIASSYVMKEATPLPVFRTFTQTARHGVAMDVAKLLRELLGIADVEIVIALLPKVGRLNNQPARDSLLQRFDRIRKRCVPRFADKKMDVLGHYDISIDIEFKSSAHALQRGLEDARRFGSGERPPAMVAAEGYKVSLPGFVEALQLRRHGSQGNGRVSPTQAQKRGLNGPPAKLALKHPDLYGFAAMMGGSLDVTRRWPAIFNPGQAWDEWRIFGFRPSTRMDEDVFVLLPQMANPGAVKWFVSCGTEDSMCEGDKEFVRQLRLRGVVAETSITTGRHDWPTWNKSLPRMFHAAGEALW